MQKEWDEGISQRATRRECERHLRRHRQAMGLLQGDLIDEWDEGYEEWQDRSLVTRFSRRLARSGRRSSGHQLKRGFAGSMGKRLEQKSRPAKQLLHLKSTIQREQAKAEDAAVPGINLNKDGNQYGPYPLGQLQELVDQGHFTATDFALYEGCSNWVGLAEVPGLRIPVPESSAPGHEEPENAVSHQSVFDDEPDVRPTEERRKRTRLGFLFRVVAPVCLGVFLLLYLCDLLNQHMGWNIPLGWDLMGTETAHPTNDGGKSEASQPQGIAGETAPRAVTDPTTISFGKPWTVPSVGLEMLWCPAGTFMMGSPKSEKGRGDDETAHMVTVTQGFWLGKHEVTQAQLKEVMGGYSGQYQGDNHPAVNLSWDEAISFCAKLTATEAGAGRLKEGFAYQLPTEAQWEYACRAGSRKAFAYGDSLSSHQANFNGNYPYRSPTKGPNLEQTTAVGAYKPNGWGFHDMHGNAWEWCHDWYAIYSGSHATDPAGLASAFNRVLRGGSWISKAVHTRSAYRLTSGKDSSDSTLGFRVSLRQIQVPPSG